MSFRASNGLELKEERDLNGGPVITILLGALFLGGHLSRIQWTGCLVVLMVITFMEYRKLIKEKHHMLYKRRTFLITLNVIKRVFLIFKEVGGENAADFACRG
ncbi:hypothetical protein [Bacillus atrophaeus]|uniref:hypothetical protein n=1 Tax=Bacillus atrophaeus TaxID=1452 RepID=UPI001EFBDCFC|nr:hypothetical protein [Bacillus atrophaeus]